MVYQSIDSVSRAETLQKYYSPLVENLVLKLSKPPNTNNCWKKVQFEGRTYIWKNSLKVFKILTNFSEKASGIDDPSRIFLNVDATLLATLITQLWNL